MGLLYLNGRLTQEPRRIASRFRGIFAIVPTPGSVQSSWTYRPPPRRTTRSAPDVEPAQRYLRWHTRIRNQQRQPVG
jgi:hypothetical protein